MNIKLKDGRTVEVDDGVSPATVETFLRDNNLEREEPSFLDSLFSKGAAAATGLGRGLSDVISAGPGSEPEMTGAKPEGITPEGNEGVLEKAFGGWHQPTGLGERMIEGGARMLPTAIASPSAPEGAVVGALPKAASYIARMFNYGALPGAAAEAAGSAVGSAADYLPDSVAKVVKPAAEMVTAATAPLLSRKFITPNTIDPSRLASARRLPKELQPTSAQLANKTEMLKRERAAEPDIEKQQAGDFTQAVAAPAGLKTKDVTAGFKDSDIERGMNQASSKIENIAQGTILDPSAIGPLKALNPQVRSVTEPQIFSDLVGLQTSKSIKEKRPDIPEKVLDLFKSVNNKWEPKAPSVPGPGGKFVPGTLVPGEEYHSALFGTHPKNPYSGTRAMEGEDYGRLRTKLHTVAKESDDPVYSKHLRDIADVLDNGMENSLHVHNKDLVGNWQDARRQYGNMLVVNKARSNAKAGEGVFTPDQVANADKAIKGERPHLKGDTDYSWVQDYARTHPKFPKGEPPKRPIIPDYIGGAAGFFGVPAAAYLMGHDPWQAAEHLGIWAGLAGETGARIFNKAGLPPMNPLTQAYKKNQLLPWPKEQVPQQGAAAMIRALMG